MALEITVLQGVDVFAQMFNAVAAFVRNETWRSLMVIAEIIGIIACMIVYFKKRDLKVMGLWLLSFVLINSLLLTPKERLVITELQTSKVKTVDNVPLGVALPMYFTTLVGNAIARTYDTLLAQPEDVQYSRTGLLFGQRLMEHSISITPNEPHTVSNLNNYMKFCIIERNVISKEFPWTTLLQSNNLKGYLDKGKEGDLMNYTAKDGKVSSKTCKDSGTQIQKDIEESLRPTARDGIVWDFARKLKIDGLLNNLTMPELNSKMAAVQNYFMGTSQAAADIYVQNMLVNQFRRSIDSYPVQLDASAVLINQTSEQSLHKMKLSHLSSYQVSGRLLPALHTTLLALMVGLFPIMVLAMFIRELAWGVVKNYLAILFSLMMWPVMFAIFNSIMNTLLYQTLNGQSFTLSNANTLKENASTMAGVAMWLTASIPFLSFKLVTNLGQSIASAGSYLGNSMIGATTADAAQTAQGNYNWANMSTNNVNGNKVDLNHSWKAGATEVQQENGAIVRQFGNGNWATDTSFAKTNARIGINWGQLYSGTLNNQASAEQKTAQEAMTASKDAITQATSFVKGYSHNRTDLNTDGYSDQNTKGFNNTEHYTSGDRVSKTNGTGEKKSTTNSQSTTETEHSGINKSIYGDVSLGGKFLDSGVVGGIKIDGSTGHKNESSAQQNAQNTQLADKLQNVIDEYNHSRDIAQVNNTVRVLLNGHQTQDAVSVINNVQNSLNKSHEHWVQASESNSRAKTYSVMAQQAVQNSSVYNEDKTTEFENYLRKSGKYTQEEATAILSPVDSSPEIAKLRNKSVQEFMQYDIGKISKGFSSNKVVVEQTYGSMSVSGYGLSTGGSGVGLNDSDFADVRVNAMSGSSQLSSNNAQVINGELEKGKAEFGTYQGVHYYQKMAAGQDIQVSNANIDNQRKELEKKPTHKPKSQKEIMDMVGKNIK